MGVILINHPHFLFFYNPTPDLLSGGVVPFYDANCIKNGQPGAKMQLKHWFLKKSQRRDRKSFDRDRPKIGLNCQKKKIATQRSIATGQAKRTSES